MEMLVVIAIIALLAVLITPAVSRALKNARRVECLSQLRQVHTYMSMYLIDHKGQYPDFRMTGGGGVDVWRDYLYPYSGIPRRNSRELGIWHCPAQSFERGSHWWRNLAGYGGNATLSHDYVSQIPNPTQTLLAIDTTIYNGWHAYHGRSVSSTIRWVSTRHDGSANMVYCDGHVETVPENRIEEVVVPSFEPGM